MILLFILMIGISIFALIVGIVEWIIDRDYRKGIVCAVIILVSIFTCKYIVNTEPQRLVNSNNIQVYHAKVVEKTTRTMKLDESLFQLPTGKNDHIISNKYPIDTSSFEVGDMVRYELLRGDFKSYIIKIEKLESSR